MLLQACMLRKFSTASGVHLVAIGGDGMIPVAAMGIHSGTSIGCQDCPTLKDGASVIRLSNTITFTLLFISPSRVPLFARDSPARVFR